MIINVASWLVARFAIVTFFQIVLNSCIVWQVRCCGKKSWETIFLKKKHVWVKKHLTFFLQKIVLVCRSQKNQIADWTLVKKNSFSTNFQGTGPWEGPVHFSRFVLRVHSCSKLFQSWSWSQEKKETPFTKATGLSLSLFLSLLFLFVFLFRFLSLSLSLVPFLFFFLCLLSQVSLRENLRWKR